MADTDEPDNIGKLLDDSQNMIRRYAEMVDKDKIEVLSPEAQKATQDEVYEEPEPMVDASFEVWVSEDYMKVTAEFRPPTGGGKPLELDNLQQVLFEKEVTYGLQWDSINDALQECNLNKRLVKDVLVAQGTPPVPFVPEHVEILPQWLTPPPTTLEDPGWMLDFKAITPFVMVKEHDQLAIRIPDAFGSPGVNCRGQEVEYPTAKPVSWVPGPHVADTPVGFEADVEGRLVLEEPNFSVNPILELPEGVGFKTGNIRFKGEVIVHGRIAAGFSIDAGGALTADDVIDAYQIRVGKELTTPAGVIGNGEGRIDVGTSVNVKFLEHVTLLAQGNVRAETCILSSTVKTRGKLVLGDKGIISGGQIHTLHNVEAFQIGTATGPRTQLYVGLDFQGMERITTIRDRTKELGAQLSKVSAAIPYGGARVAELQAAAAKLRLEIGQLTETARNQLMNLAQNDDAAVEVRGKVFPGTHIEICHVQFLVTQLMSGVRFYLDKRKGSIAVEPLVAKNAPPKPPKPAPH